MNAVVGRVGPYELRALIGVGGMGQVYRARDVRLDRDVAVKLLSDPLGHDPVRLERFEREARAAAALQHPNVVVTLDAGWADGAPYIVTELLNGKTLRDAIVGGNRFPPPTAVGIGAQIARGLAAAHAHGIVHRDLKPENVVLTEDGVAKIIDFGLARITAPVPPCAAADTPTLTEPGALIGTVGYMAPEQVRGRDATHLADIFAFGAILFELLTGRRAFAAPTPADTLAAILSREIDPADLGEVPSPLAQIVARCLAKPPESRFQSAADLAFALDSFSGAARAVLAPPPLRTVEATRRLGRWPRALAVAGVLIAVMTPMVFRDPDPRVTGYVAITRRPVFFPPFPSEYPLVTDGPRVYFTEWANGRLTVGQVAAAGGELAEVPLSVGRHHLVDAISPDGSEVLIGTPEEGKDEEQFYAVPLVAGTPRKLPGVVAHGGSWLADGRILYTRGSDVFVAGPDGTGNRRLLGVPGRAYWLRVSPDGTRVRFTLFRPEVRYASLWEARLDGSDLHQLLNDPSQPSHECCGEWTPDGGYYVFQATRGNQSHIWAVREPVNRLSLRKPVPVQLTSGPVQFRRAVPSRDGRKLFAIGWQLRGELSRYDRERRAFVAHVPGLSAEWVAYSADGRSLAYVTYPEEELWRARSDGTSAQRLVSGSLRALMPDWSPDARQLAFTGDRGDAPPSVFVVDVDGGSPRRVAEGRSPSWSPDGRFIAYEHGGRVRILDLRSGASTGIDNDARLASPGWSPDGRYLIAARPEDGRLLLYEFEARRWSEIRSTTWAERPVWSRDGGYLYFLGYRAPPVLRAVWRARIADGRAEEVVAIDTVPLVWGAAGFWLGLTPENDPLLLRDQSRHDLYALEWDAR